MTTENTALTVQARAALALESSAAETYLTELAGKSKAIVAITNKDGRTECHAAAMTAKKARINIEKAGESAREDATAFSKAVISEEARLVALIKPEETRLLGLRDDWDAKVKAEKEAEEALESQRIEAIKARIAEFGAMITDAAMLEAHGVEQEIEVALAVEIDDAFGEFYDEAVTVKAAAIAKLRDLLAAKTAAEAAAARIKAEQEAETIRLAEEAKRLAAERLAFDAQQAEAQQKQAAELAELERQRKEIAEAQAKAEAEQRRIAAAERAEQERIASALQAEDNRIQREATAALAADMAAKKAEADRLATEEIRKLDEQRKAEESTKTASRNDMKRLEFRSELIARIDLMSIVQMANLISYMDAQVIRAKIAA